MQINAYRLGSITVHRGWVRETASDRWPASVARSDGSDKRDRLSHFFVEGEYRINADSERSDQRDKSVDTRADGRESRCTGGSSRHADAPGSHRTATSSRRMWGLLDQPCLSAPLHRFLRRV